MKQSTIYNKPSQQIHKAGKLGKVEVQKKLL